MGFAESSTTCMGKYATYEGRATISEFWLFYLFTLLLGWGAAIVGTVSLGLEGGLYRSIYSRRRRNH